MLASKEGHVAVVKALHAGGAQLDALCFMGPVSDACVAKTVSAAVTIHVFGHDVASNRRTRVFQHCGSL